MLIEEKDTIKEECKQLWHLYRDYIRRFCENRLKSSPNYIEDCVQDVFTALLEAKRSGTEIKNPKAWLTTVANNKIKKEYKNRKRESEHISKIIQYGNYVETSFIETHDFENVPDEIINNMKDRVLQQLSSEERSLVDDFYVKHIKIKDIAIKYGLSETNVKQRLFRVRKKIVYLSNDEIAKQKF